MTKTRTVHLYREDRERGWDQGDPSLCGYTEEIGGMRHLDSGVYLHRYFSGEVICDPGKSWCPKCLGAIDPLEELAHTDL